MPSTIEDRQGDDVFALDKWLRNLGLWRTTSLRKQNPAQRRAQLDQMDFSQPYVLTGTDFDPDGYQLINVTSTTSYDPDTGVFEDKIVYWRNRPEENSAEQESSDQYVIAIRGVRNPAQNDPHMPPEIIPDQVWFNGSQIFNGTYNGGNDDPHWPENRRLLARVMELSQRVKEKLNNQEPAREIARVFAGEDVGEHFTAAAFGGAPAFRGLNADGEWDRYERLIGDYFTDFLQDDEEKLRFNLPGIGRLSAVDRLKSMNGYHMNSVEPVRGLQDIWDQHAADLMSGMGYLASTEYEEDPETGDHVFRILVAPEDVPADMEALEPFELAKLVFRQDDAKSGVFTLEEADFMERGAGEFRSFKEGLSVIGLMQDANRYLSKRQYPPFYDIIARHRLLDKVNELHIPPSLEEEGGETVWIPLFGTNLDKQVEQYGDGLGGGNLFMQRGRRADGTIDEVAVLQGLPWEPGNADSAFDGAQPDIMAHAKALRRGVIVIDHIHFDHSTIEFYAKMRDEDGKGWLQGQKILCKGIDAYIMKDRMKRLGVPKEQWPSFIEFDAEDALEKYEGLYKLGKDHFAYRIKDEEGNTRFFVQISKNGTLHSALTDSSNITGCYNDNFQTSYYIPNDTLDINQRGWKFFEGWAEPLARLKGVTLENIKKAGRVALEEPTGVTSDGNAPRVYEFKETLRVLSGLIPDDNAIISVPFSTNHLEIQALREVWAEEETLRNSTAVGANAQTRDTAMNLYGVNPELDLRTVKISADRLPQRAYDVALTAVDDFLEKRRGELEKQQRDGASSALLEAVLALDAPYQVFQHIKDQAELARRRGHTKPAILHRAFFAGDEQAFTKLAKDARVEADNPEFSMFGAVKKALEKEKKAMAEALGGGHAAKADTALWMMKSLAKHGKVKFRRKCAWNEYNMYQAIMAGQDTAALHAGRSSKTAKGFRAEYGALGVISTGPIGSAEEQFASLSRFARGDSLFDYDEAVRNTGYKLNPEKMVIWVTQTPSMGDAAALAQDKLMKDVANNRNVTVFCGFKNGIKIYNPKENRARYEEEFRKAGWDFEWDAGANQLRVHGQPFHISGHSFEGDIVRRMSDPRYKPDLVEAIHIPSWTHFQRLKEIVQKTGHKMSVDKPKDFVARRFIRDPETGEAYMKEMSHLTPRYWLVQKRAKYGQQYGWVINMIQAVGTKRTGQGRNDPLMVRRDADQYYEQNTAWQMFNRWARPANGNTARSKMLGPSPVDIDEAGNKPKGMMAGAAVARQRMMKKMQEPAGMG